jgi:hypothetical protein
MTADLANVLSRHLRPRCSRDNHVIKHESGGSRANTGGQASYHCGYLGCSVRYNSAAGYHMVMGIPKHTYAVDEPGVNTLKCPRHDDWLYRERISISNMVWIGVVA